MRRLLGIAALCLSLIASAAAAAPKELVIGLSQFPSNFNPLIDSMLAKSYMLALARRPITVYDQDWNLVCLLCTELPDLTKGTAVPEKTKDGKDGIAVTYALDPDAVWGDGTPITTKDVLSGLLRSLLSVMTPTACPPATKGTASKLSCSTGVPGIWKPRLSSRVSSISKGLPD